MSQICLNSDNLDLVIQIPNTQSIEEFLSQFGTLWIGQIQPSVFSATFNELKQKVLPWLVDLAVIDDNDDYRIGHKLDLCHQALESQWRLPGTATIANGDFFWESGLSRILAGGLAWNSAWQQHRLLMLSSEPVHVAQYLTNFNKINNAPDLIKELGNNCKINTRLSVDNQYRTSIRLGAIQEKVPTTRSYLVNTAQRVDTLREWIKRYPNGSKLNVYTDHPENIIDSVGFWDINHCGPGMKFDIPGNIDAELYKLSKIRSSGVHEFYVQSRTDKIDVAELLFWQDLKYTVFATQDWQCVLRRPDQDHYVKIIGISQL